MQKLFVYGTLRDPRVRRRLFGRAVSSRPAVLKGWKRSAVIIEHKKYPAIVPSRERRVRGMLISLTTADLRRLDTYETRAYRRMLIITTDGASAWVYRKK